MLLFGGDVVSKTPRSRDRHSTPATGNTWGPSARLELVDELVDWSRFDRYLRWLDAPPGDNPSHTPRVLFKAMLIQQWFALGAAEFEYDMADRLSYRRFAGLAPDQAVPDHAAICEFRRKLVERGMAVELFAELQQQFERHDLAKSPDALKGVSANRHCSTDLYSLATDAKLFRPPHWVSLEQSFLDYWNEMRGERDVPLLPDTDFADIPEQIRPQLILIRPLPNEDGFRYEKVGKNVEVANGYPMAGTTVGEKARRNVREYGHVGMQGEWQRVLHTAATEKRPVGTTGCFFNAIGDKRQAWVIVAPIRVPNEAATMLMGVALIRPVEPLAFSTAGQTPFTLAHLLATNDLSSFLTRTRPPGPPEWMALEQSFLNYWNQKRGHRKVPLLSDIRLSEIPEFEPHLTLLRVLPDGGFRYETVGSHIKTANEGDATGSTVNEKTLKNFKDYGHPGLQRELAAIYDRATKEMRAVGSSTYYVNSGGNKCQFWGLVAPLSDLTGSITMLLGIALIKPVPIN